MNDRLAVQTVDLREKMNASDALAKTGYNQSIAEPSACSGLDPSMQMTQCPECDGRCSECGGELDERSPVQQALAWGAMSARTESDPVWRLARIDQVLREAPANDGGPAWMSASRSIQSLLAIITFGSQGRNASTAVREALRRWTVAHPDRTSEVPVPTFVERSDSLPGNPPNDKPGWSDQCCCKAADVFVDSSTSANGMAGYDSRVVVTLDVNKGRGEPKGCTLEWEELPNYTYEPGVPPPVKENVYTNLTAHPGFRKMAKAALKDLEEVCPLTISPFTDTPHMATNGRLVIRITLKSGCDATSVTVYVVLTAPTSIVEPVITDPKLVKAGDPDFKALEAEYAKAPKAVAE